jgi:hypothetical protein
MSGPLYSEGMGREAHSFTDGTELDLNEVSEVVQADHMRRLRVQLEALMRAMEAIDPPTDHAGAEKFAKAISAVNKAVRDVNAPQKDHKPQGTEDEDMDENKGGKKIRPGTAINSSGDPQYDGMYDWQIDLERKLIKLARARSQKLGDDPGDGAGTG